MHKTVLVTGQWTRQTKEQLSNKLYRVAEETWNINKNGTCKSAGSYKILDKKTDKEHVYIECAVDGEWKVKGNELIIKGSNFRI